MKERKEVWIHPNVNEPDRCPVMIIDKYVSLYPEYNKKREIFTYSHCPTPPQHVGMSKRFWVQILQERWLRKLMAETGYPGFYFGS